MYGSETVRINELMRANPRSFLYNTDYVLLGPICSSTLVLWPSLAVTAPRAQSYKLCITCNNFALLCAV